MCLSIVKSRRSRAAVAFFSRTMSSRTAEMLPIAAAEMITLKSMKKIVKTRLESFSRLRSPYPIVVTVANDHHIDLTKRPLNSPFN